jgi:hypothetical protein
MEDQKTKQIVIVLSPGRSGSSLLMKVLEVFGMSLSRNLIPSSESNPEGFFEDADIVEVHKELLEQLHTNPTLPMPDNWIESEITNQAMIKLYQILEDRLSVEDTIWGFKDPRTVSILPLWLKLLKDQNISPVFILAVRDPASVVNSLKLQVNRRGLLSENQWLVRTTEALYYTSGFCQIIHYEDWFTRPLEVASELMRYTGLDQSYSGDLQETLNQVIKPDLNRASQKEYTIQNSYVERLYDILKECRGSEFNRQQLMGVVNQCRKAIHGFKGWYLEAHKHIAKSETLEKRLTNRTKKLNREKKQAKQIEADYKLLERKSSSQIRDLQKEISSLKKTISLQKIRIRRWKHIAEDIKKSDAFILGELVENALKKPSMKTFLLPYNLIKFLVQPYFKRRSKKEKKAAKS